MKTPTSFRAFLFSLAAATASADQNPHDISDPLIADAALLTSGFFAAAAPQPAAPANAAELGSWGSVIPWTPHIPVTAACLPDGRLLTFASNKRTTFPEGPEFTYVAVWDPATGVFTEINNTRHDMFCGGTSLLPDGRLVINGGRNTTTLSSIFDYRTNQWSAIQNMKDPRWYNTSLSLPDGSVFTVSGSGGTNTAELWNSATGWRRLTGINWQSVLNQPGYIIIWHPFVMLAPNGSLFHFGPTDAMNWLTTTGNGSLTPSGRTIPGPQYPKEGAWAMYDEGRILVAGGGANTTPIPDEEDETGISTTAAYTVNLNGTTPVVATTAPMTYARQFPNSVVLPNGEVMIIGGNTSGLKVNDTGSILTPEIWNPTSGTWRTVANMTIPRNYHSVALLLPDGRVWSAGGGLGGNSADHRDAQIFTPPSLFNPDGSPATRPVITQAPTQIGIGNQFTVQATPGLTRFALIRMSSQTHSTNTDLRYLTLPFTETSPGNYTLTGHSNQNVMLPGYWMLFGLDASGVHSVSKTLQVILGSNVSVVNPGSQQSAAGSLVDLTIATSAPAGTTLQFAAAGLPGGLSIQASTGVISGTITAAPGTFPTTITVTPSGTAPIQISFTWNVFAPNPGNGTVLREWWLGLPGDALTDLTTAPAFPADPSGRDTLTSLEAPANFADQYGQRIRGYLLPVITGPHSFWIAGDDECRLLLSTDESPANAVEIAAVPESSGVRQWTLVPDQASDPINLEAGKRYYIEALMKDHDGGDHLAVAWQPPGATGITVIPGTNLTSYDAANAPVAAWQFDEALWNGTSAEVRELVGKVPAIHGTSTSGATTASAGPALSGNPGTGRFGSFPGNDAHVTIPFHAALNPGDFTITAWVRPLTQTSAADRAVIVSRQTVASATRGFGLYAAADGKWKFFTGSSWTALSGPDIAAGQWSHLAATFRTTSISNGVRTGIRRIYLNGVQVAQDNGSYVPVTNSPMLVGAADNSGTPAQFMIGDIDEPRIHAAPLGTTDIASTMALRHAIDQSPAVTSPGPLTDLQDSVISRTIQASDPEGLAVTFSASGLPDGLSISPASGIISGLATTLGTFNATVTATDPGGNSSSASFLWTIVEPLGVTPAASPPLPQASGVTFTATSTGGIDPLYQWNFGDGSPDTEFSASSSASHTFPGPGRYLVTVTATDSTGAIVSGSFHQAIHAPLTANRPTSSSPTCLSNNRLWTVNPDNDSVTVIDAVTRAKLAEIPVGTSPRCVAAAPDGRIWITNALSATLSIVSPDTLTVLETVSMPHGSRPFGIAFAPDGSAAFVTLEAAGKLLKLDPVSGDQVADTDVGPNVRHLSIPGDSARVYVSRFITPRLPGEETATVSTTAAGGEVIVVAASTGTIEQTLLLHHSEEPDTTISARGIPNYLGAPTLTPDGLSAWIPSKQDNIKRGMLRDSQELTHDMSVRAIASRLDLTLGTEDTAARVDFDNAGVPSAIAIDPWGIYAFVALEASRMVAVMDVWNHREILRFDAGRAPQGLAISPDGHTLFVHNFMDRSITIHDVTSLIEGLAIPPPPAETVAAVATEKLPPQILLGKQLFYDAKDNRLALQEYLSCAACHNDGGEDGRVWDFTGFGEGLRNTISLRGHGGTRQGPLHWSGNFDEVQDFENQIRNFAGGLGLISGTPPHPPLGAPNAGLSPELDALAAYLQSLDTYGESPHRQNDGSLTPSAQAGELIYRTLDCTSCHGGPEYTRSASGNLPDIGTLKPSSGNRLGQPLTGLDIPTLRGLWNTAPYLHDGSAATLEEAITAHQNVAISGADLANLVAYLESIDDESIAAPLPTNTFAGWAEVTPGADGNPNSDGDGDNIPDLLEFALGGLPNNPASPVADAVTIEKSAGNFKMHVKRKTGLKGLTWEVLTSGDLVSWTATPAAPLVATGANGMETLSFENLQNQPGITEAAGYARLRVSMDQPPPP